MTKLALLFLAGGCGCLARFGLVGLIHRLIPNDFPVGTTTVNLLGCLLFGFVWPMAEERLVISPETRVLILTGFMGSFTTFSTFAFESEKLIGQGQWIWAATNVGGQTIFGIVAIAIGLALCRWMYY